MTRRVLVVTAILFLSFALRAWLAAAPDIPLRQPLADFPGQLAEWQLVQEEHIDDDTMHVLKADDYLLRTYRNSTGQPAGLFIAYYRTQHAGESMHSPKNCLPGSGWQPTENDRVLFGNDPAGHPVWVNRYLVEKDGERQLVLYWYQANGRMIASEYWGKIYMIWDAIRLGRRDGAIVRISVPVPASGSVDGALESAEDLARTSLPYLARFLPS